MKLKKIMKNSIMETIFYFFIAIVGLLKVKYIIEGIGTDMNGYFQFINNIISYIILAESGISTAILYKMYKPMAEKDYSKISQLFNGSRKILRVIGLIFLILGICVIPLIYLYTKELNLFITVTFCFLLLIFAVAYPYLRGTRSYTTLLTADQNRFSYGLIYNTSKLISDILIIIFVLKTHSMISIVIINLVFKFAETAIIQVYCKKKYNWIDKNLPADVSAKKMSSYMVCHQIGYAVFSNVDIVLIMTFLGPATVSIYSAYNYIINFIRDIFDKNNQMISNIFGYSFAVNDNKTYDYYNSYVSTFTSLSLIVASCFFIGARSFINLWIGKEEYILNPNFSFCFSLIIILNVIYINISSIFQSNGLFKESRFFPIIESVLNIVISILLLKFMGISGILLATSISSIIGILLRTKLISDKIFTNHSYFSFLVRPFAAIIFYLLLYYPLKSVENIVFLNSAGYIQWVIIMVFMFICLSVLILSIVYILDNAMKSNFKIIMKKIRKEK